MEKWGLVEILTDTLGPVTDPVTDAAMAPFLISPPYINYIVLKKHFMGRKLGLRVMKWAVLYK